MQQYPKLFLVTGSEKGKLLSKIHLPITVTQLWIPPRKYFNLINVRYGDMSNNISFPYSSFNTSYESFHRGFPLSLTWLNATYWANLSLIFAFSEGVISSLNDQQKFYHQWSKMQMKMNKTDKHSYFPVKLTTLEHQVLIFIVSYVFVRPGGTSKGPFSDSSNNLE